MENILQNPIVYLKGVGPKRGELLKKELNITTYEDLLSYYPFRYVDRSKISTVKEVNEEMAYVQLRGKIFGLQSAGSPKPNRMVAYLRDSTGMIELLWFQGFKWIKEKIREGNEYVVFGKPSVFNNNFSIVHPELEEAVEFDKNTNSVFHPIYSTTEKLKSVGLDARNIGKLTRQLISVVENEIFETFPPGILAAFNMISRKDAIANIHWPKDESLMELARYRLKFEEFFYIQLQLLYLKTYRHRAVAGHFFKNVGDYFNEFYFKHLPFELTAAQKKVIREIRADLGNGRQMNRLLQGDVGSGKTVVSLLIMLLALDNGYQACMMAPTEILASQHFETIGRLLQPMDVEIALLTGSTKTSVRKTIFSRLREGTLHILIGTHAVLEDQVVFKNLGIVIIDEQHRFGVAQRATMWGKNTIPPHILVMTATPIPRTLAMTLYGDLDVSVIDELPPGRKPVKTYFYNESKRPEVYRFMKKMIAAGNQVFIVYPLISESETLDLQHLEEGYENICQVFPYPDFSVTYVHGKMRPDEKELAMQKFLNRNSQILLSTTVIEVGVDVPQASVMIIENAERFGLSQLHQLRGRVGRGAEQSYCILMTGTKLTREARMRLETMVQTNNGFEIAEVDLKLRGPGDIQGTRQSGIINLKIADIIKDEKILREARQMATQIVSEDPELMLKQNGIIKQRLSEILRDNEEWALIS